MDSNFDLSMFWDQIVHDWGLVVNLWGQVAHFFDQPTHWILNDGWSVGVFLVFLAVSGITVFCAAKDRNKRILMSRAGYTVENFLAEMEAAGHDVQVARTVYQFIQGTYRVGFPIQPGDDLYLMLGITDASVWRAMPALLQATGREPRIGRLLKPIVTVQELVHFVEVAPMVSERGWQLQTA